jgi:putative ABC transport system permease protein
VRAGDVPRLVWGGLGAHALRTRMTSAAIAIGVASVLLLTALGEGARTWVASQFSTLGANALVVLPGRTETRGGIPLLPASTRDVTLDDARAVARRLPGVQRVIPVVIGEAPVSREGRSRAATVIGSTADYLGLLGAAVQEGANLPVQDLEADARVCVLGRTLARELSGESNPLGARVRVGEYSYRVLGVLGARGQSMMVNLDEVVLVPVAGALKMFNRSGLFRLIVQVTPAAGLERTGARLEAILKDRHDGEEDFTILTPGAIAASFDSVIRILTAALAGIAAISLAVAGVGVMNVMVVTVAERTSEIGLMKALGAGRGQILLLFLSEAVALSLVGGVLGAAAGFGLVRAAGALGLLPAARAARLEPLDALRKRA